MTPCSNCSNWSAPTRPARSARIAGGRGWRWRIRGCRRRPSRGASPRRIAIAPHGSEKVPVLLDGDTAVVDSWTNRQLSGRYLSGPAVAVRRRGRPGDGADDELVGRHTVIGGMFPLIVADIPLASEAGGRCLFPQSPRSAFGKPLEEIIGRPRQGRRGFPPVARSAAADLAGRSPFSAARRRTMPTTSCSARSSGRAWSARSSC